MLTVERLQVMLDKDLYEELCRRSLAEGVSKAELVRRAVRAAYPPIELPPLEEDPLFAEVGFVKGEPSGDPKATVDEVVYDWEYDRWHRGTGRRRGKG